MSLTVTPLSDALGAEIHGVDPRLPFDADTRSGFLDALHDHIVLVFRGAAMDETQQIAFAAQFGALGERSRPVEMRAEASNFSVSPKVMLVSNIRDSAGGLIGSLPDGEMWFHHDTSFADVAHKLTLLNASEIPATGGHTRFANSYLAYDAVPAALKQMLTGRTVMQIFNFRQTERLGHHALATEDLSRYPHAIHSVFITHPATGRKVLYVSRLISARIRELPEDESDAILEELFTIAETPDFIYEHHWKPGDLVVWDNYCSMHARTHYDPAERRLLRRCSVIGEALHE